MGDFNNINSKQYIYIKGARIHNLKNVTIKIPKNKLIVFTGISGSGKSSLVFDTIYAESQRQYVNSLDSYSRQFMNIKTKSLVDGMIGLTPAISINQKNENVNPRSTTGTVSEIYDYLRVFFAKIGVPYCYKHNIKIDSLSLVNLSDIIIQKYYKRTISCYSPIEIKTTENINDLVHKLVNEGFTKILVENEVYELHPKIKINFSNSREIKVLIHEFTINNNDEETQEIVYDALEICLHWSNGKVEIICDKKNDIYTTNNRCTVCDLQFPKIGPNLFSFNSSYGACEICSGIGVIYDINPKLLFDYEKTISEGGIEFFKNYVGTENIWWQEIIILCKHYKISLNTKMRNLTNENVDIILNGSKEPITFFINKNNKPFLKRTKIIEGVGAKIKRLHEETSSELTQSYYYSFMSEIECNGCKGGRLNKFALNVYVNKKNIYDLCKMEIDILYKYFDKLKLKNNDTPIVKNLISEVKQRLDCMKKIGLNYLTLSRVTKSLSGGEYQRLRLSKQIKTFLTGITYVLDEPSIGLHQKDNIKLIELLKSIRDIGNTIIVVEHDEEMIRSADWVVDMGLYAGKYGGNIIVEGKVNKLLKSKESITAKYLNKVEKITRPKIATIKKLNNYIELVNCFENNLKNINVKIPLSKFVCITGISGSGKSTLINEILVNSIKHKLNQKVKSIGLHKRIKNWYKIKKVISISQKSIGKSIRSTSATYVGVFGYIRELFARLELAKYNGFDASYFSFNTNKGKCSKCNGHGNIKISMLFMPDETVVCSQCKGKRYKKKVLSIKYKGKSIFDILNMTVKESLLFFKSKSRIKKYLIELDKVGLNYVKLNQPTTQLSGGEAQRLKLATYLIKKEIDENTLITIDEPTTGLHFYDISKLIHVFQEIIERRASLIVIEHNLDIIKNADYIIDLGPGGGRHGGKVIAKGSIKEFLKYDTYTSKYLRMKIEDDNIDIN